jgi:hypothetical protein
MGKPHLGQVGVCHLDLDHEAHLDRWYDRGNYTGTPCRS